MKKRGKRDESLCCENTSQQNSNLAGGGLGSLQRFASPDLLLANRTNRLNAPIAVPGSLTRMPNGPEGSESCRQTTETIKSPTRRLSCHCWHPVKIVWLRSLYVFYSIGYFHNHPGGQFFYIRINLSYVIHVDSRSSTSFFNTLYWDMLLK